MYDSCFVGIHKGFLYDLIHDHFYKVSMGLYIKKQIIFEYWVKFVVTKSTLLIKLFILQFHNFVINISRQIFKSLHLLCYLPFYLCILFETCRFMTVNFFVDCALHYYKMSFGYYVIILFNVFLPWILLWLILLL